MSTGGRKYGTDRDCRDRLYCGRIYKINCKTENYRLQPVRCVQQEFAAYGNGAGRNTGWNRPLYLQIIRRCWTVDV